MKYMGSKSRIAKHILPIILKDRKPNQYYVEPFVGGCNIIDKVDGLRLGGDYNKYLIAMWKGIQKGVKFPEVIPKSLYNEARHRYYNNYSSSLMDEALIGWIGFMASFNGRFFDGGYSGISGNRDYISEQIRNTMKQVDNIRDIEFDYSDYHDLMIPRQSIIYCDPPYRGTKQYDISKDFNYHKFYEWCKDMHFIGHTVFISEYQMPPEFKCVWEMEVTNSLNTTKTYKPIERLYTL